MVDPNNRSMTQVMSDVSPGRYFAPAMTNQLFATPGADRVYFTVPDGLTNNTVSIYALQLAEMGIAPIIDGQAVVSSVSTKPYMRTNHTAILTPDNRWLAMIRNDANNNARLSLLELAAPELPAIELPLGERNAIVDEMLFSPNQEQLYYITSGSGSALYRLDLLTGAEIRIARGVYGRGVMSPQGTALALVTYETINDRDTYMKLVVYDLTTNIETVLFTGAEIVENKITNQQFVYPLAWRSGQ
jgi:Tol biopolymer transport system component